MTTIFAPITPITKSGVAVIHNPKSEEKIDLVQADAIPDLITAGRSEEKFNDSPGKTSRSTDSEQLQSQVGVLSCC